MRTKLGSAFLGLALTFVLSSSALASGFAIIEQSVSGLGNAFSATAAAEDATTVFFNPAGLTLLEGQQVVAGGHIIVPSTKFSATTAQSTPLPDGAGGYFVTSLGTNNGGDGGVTAFVPNFYYSNKLNDRLAIGLGINAPFGLATDYDQTWVGRYHAKESDVMTLNINPAIAWKVTDQLSIAAGISAEYIDVTLSSMVNGGLVAYQGALMSGAPAATLAALAPTVSNTAYDVLVENAGDDWGFGFNLGLIYEICDEARIGLAYRSEIKHKLKGDVSSAVPAALLAVNPLLAGAFQPQDINGSITLPATASLSFYQKVNDKLSLTADVTWTGWSSFDELVIYFEGTGIAGNTSTKTTENWDDTWRYSVGATYQATEKLKLRCGLAFDETPIPDDYRTPRIPGEDRLWLALGTGYQFTEKFAMDFAYAHLFVDDSKMLKYASTPEDVARGTVVGEFDNAVDIASIQFSYSF